MILYLKHMYFFIFDKSYSLKDTNPLKLHVILDKSKKNARRTLALFSLFFYFLWHTIIFLAKTPKLNLELLKS